MSYDRVMGMCAPCRETSGDIARIGAGNHERAAMPYQESAELECRRICLAESERQQLGTEMASKSVAGGVTYPVGQGMGPNLDECARPESHKVCRFWD